MTLTTTSKRPKKYKAIAIAGILVNSVSLTILAPISIYGTFAYPEKIPILQIFSVASWFIYFPLTIILLVGAIGLFFHKQWSRKLCILALCFDIFYSISTTLLDTLIRIANWDSSTIFALMLVPVSSIIVIFEAVVLIYLKDPRVKQYLECWDPGRE